MTMIRETHIKMPLSRMTFSRMTLSRVTLLRIAFSRVTLTRITLSRKISYKWHLEEWHSAKRHSAEWRCRMTIRWKPLRRKTLKFHTIYTIHDTVTGCTLQVTSKIYIYTCKVAYQWFVTGVTSETRRMPKRFDAQPRVNFINILHSYIMVLANIYCMYDPMQCIRKEFLSKIHWIYYWRLFCSKHKHYNYFKLI
jgi:hypothetical protein